MQYILTRETIVKNLKVCPIILAMLLYPTYHKCDINVLTQGIEAYNMSLIRNYVTK